MCTVFVLMCVNQVTAEAQRIQGEQKNGSCVCKLSSSIWAFPAVRFEGVQKQLQTCEENLLQFHKKVRFFEFM